MPPFGLHHLLSSVRTRVRNEVYQGYDASDLPWRGLLSVAGHPQNIIKHPQTSSNIQQQWTSRKASKSWVWQGTILQGTSLYLVSQQAANSSNPESNGSSKTDSIIRSLFPFDSFLFNSRYSSFAASLNYFRSPSEAALEQNAKGLADLSAAMVLIPSSQRWTRVRLGFGRTGSVASKRCWFVCWKVGHPDVKWLM